MLLLAYDVGTSLIKATLINKEAEVISSSSIGYETLNRAPLYAEQNPKTWWECICKVTAKLKALKPNEMSKVLAIGVSGHMLGCLALNCEGEPLYPALIHSDLRAKPQMERIKQEIGEAHLYSLTGGVLSPGTTLCKLLWLYENEPAVYKKTARFLQAKDYIVYRLTGNMDSTDYSDASHGQLINIHTGDLLHDELKCLNLNSAKLPCINKSTDLAGSLSAKAAAELGLCEGIPVVAGGGDGACANVGAGITGEGDIYCSLGTTAWIAYNSALPVIDEKRRIFNITALNGEHAGVFGTMQSAGKAVDWAKSLFSLESAAKLDEVASLAPPGCEGLVFLPYLEGERSPIFNENAAGVFFGITSRHTKAHFARAVLEGVAFALRSILDVYREQRQFDYMKLIGGGAKSAFWLQLIADICGIELRTLKGGAAITSLGAAFAAGVAVGVYKNFDETAALIKTDKVISNDPEAGIYEQMYNKYISLYPSIKHLF
ncbi:MAG TPA: FGGY family carbohydrate kinase [Clostridia bacterium]|nr:FGGY family carbohydrate kinase [Clostridia bacterium]